ncbi:hypothetical protein EBZ38_14010, partial [bacterium]|nr:hypothetical protein [bacterium]
MNNFVKNNTFLFNQYFNPKDISGLILWLDANDSSTLYDSTTGGSIVSSDGIVKRWEDKSGNNYHATAENGPQRKINQLNNKDTLYFNGSQQLQISNSNTNIDFRNLHYNNSTFFLVVKPGIVSDPQQTYYLIGNSRTLGPGINNRGFRILFDDFLSGRNNHLGFVLLNDQTTTVTFDRTNNVLSPNIYSSITIISKPSDPVATRTNITINNTSPYGNNTGTGSLLDNNNSISVISIG